MIKKLLKNIYIQTKLMFILVNYYFILSINHIAQSESPTLCGLNLVGPKDGSIARQLTAGRAMGVFTLPWPPQPQALSRLRCARVDCHRDP